jgi:nicotinamidase-related amidase
VFPDTLEPIAMETSLKQSAVLLMDLQHDFLCAENGRMPVDAQTADFVITVANAILLKETLVGVIPIMVVNHFPTNDRVANFFRKGAAVEGTPGAQLDARIKADSQVKTIIKANPSAFANPELDLFLQANGIREIYVMGVFAEGCVRATVKDAKKRGYVVHVIATAIASNAKWKKRFALWAMQRCGALIISHLPDNI